MEYKKGGIWSGRKEMKMEDERMDCWFYEERGERRWFWVFDEVKKCKRWLDFKVEIGII